MSPSRARSSKAAKAGVVTLDLPEPELLPIDEVVPYWRNPRRINDEAVNAIVVSIREYGYSQPIVVDEAKVIIIGHTRYTALRRMGVREVPVITVTNLNAAQVKELRILDNRSGEYTSWDFEQLTTELEDMNLSLMRSFFPEVGSIKDDGPDAAISQDDGPDTSAWDEVDRTAEFICPSCFHSWEMEVTRKAVMAGELKVSQ